MVSKVDGENFTGVDIGHMMFYASDTTGEFSRYRWSSYGASQDYDVTARPVSAARVVCSPAPGTRPQTMVRRLPGSYGSVSGQVGVARP